MIDSAMCEICGALVPPYTYSAYINTDGGPAFAIFRPMWDETIVDGATLVLCDPCNRDIRGLRILQGECRP
jgi:hypothetical protein